MATDMDNRTKDLYQAFNAHDMERYVAFHTEDVSFEQVIDKGARGQGKEELRSFAKGFFDAFPDFRCEVTSFFASGNRQCEVSVWTGTHKGDFQGYAPTGRTFSVQGVLIRELKGSTTSRFSIYFDSASLMKQLGL